MITSRALNNYFYQVANQLSNKYIIEDVFVENKIYTYTCAIRKKYLLIRKVNSVVTHSHLHLKYALELRTKKKFDWTNPTTNEPDPF